MSLTTIAILLIGIICFIILTHLVVKNPLNGLILVMAAMPLDQRFSLSSPIGSLSFSNVFLLLTFFSFVLVWVLQKGKIKTPGSIILVWSWYLLSTFWGLGSSSARIIITVSAAFLLFLLMVEIPSKSEDVVLLCKAFVWISFLQSIIALFMYLLFFLSGTRFGIMDSWISGSLVPRAIGVHLDPNYLGISLFMGFSMSLALKNNFRRKFFSFFVPATILTTLLITLSRTVWAGGIVILVVSLTNKLVKNYGMKRSALLGIVIISIFSSAFLPILVDRFSVARSFVESTERSISPRYATFVEAVGIISQNPLFGVGTTAATEQYTHNTFLYAGLRSGLFGMIPLVIIVFYPLLYLLRSFKGINQKWEYVRIGTFAGLLATILGAMTMGIEGHKMLWIAVSLSYAIVFIWKSSKMEGRKEISEAFSNRG